MFCRARSPQLIRIRSSPTYCRGADTQAAQRRIPLLSAQCGSRSEYRQPADVNLLFDKLSNASGGVHGRYRNTNNICANAFQRFDLINRRFHVSGTRVLVIDWTAMGALSPIGNIST